MNILIACNYSPNFSGNFIGSLVDLGLFLRERQHQPVFAFPKTDITTARGTFPDYMRSFGLKVILYEKDDFETIRWMVEEYCLDLLHIHFGAFLFSILDANENLKCKIIFHDHMYFKLGMPKVKSRYWLAMDSKKYKQHGISVIAVNKTKSLNYVFAHSKYIPNALSYKRPVSHSFTREEFRQRAGFEPDDYICLIYGYNAEVKGLDIAVEAVAIARRENPDIKLAVLGLGDCYSKCWQMDFVQQKTGIDPQSDWIRYIPTTDDMFSLDRAVDVFLSCSRTEAFPYAILEAISTDTACVVSDINGTKWANEYSRCRMFRHGDGKSCAKAVLKCFHNKSSRSSNAEALMEKYNIGRWCDRVYREYEKVWRSNVK